MVSKKEYIEDVVREIVNRRSDLSNYLIHLTREYGGYTAKENLFSILSQKRIEARNPDCICKSKIPVEMIDKFKVLSFTETPLNQVKNLVDIRFKREVKLQSYGVIFSKKDLVIKGVSPVLYLYQQSQRDFFEMLFEKYLAGSLDENFLSIGNFVKGIHDREDFHWEREWKKAQDFDFSSTKYEIIVPTLYDAKEVYKQVYLGNGESITFYVVEMEDWVHFLYYEDWPISSDDKEVLVTNYYEVCTAESVNFETKLTLLDRIELSSKLIPVSEFWER